VAISAESPLEAGAPAPGAAAPRARAALAPALLPRAFTARRVPAAALAGIEAEGAPPRAGDLVVARVGELRRPTRLELADGRVRALLPGDAIVVPWGRRSLPGRFEAEVPAEPGPCHLVAPCGLAARILVRHEPGAPEPAPLEPVGHVVGPDGRRLNLASFALAPAAGAGPRVPTFAIFGSARGAGQCDAAAALVRGLTRAGLRAGYARILGTGSACDMAKLEAAGAARTLDAGDAGLASTDGLAHAEVERVLSLLVGQLGAAGVDARVLEIADGLFQPETAELLPCALFRRLADAVLFAARDSVGAAAGAALLRGARLRVLGVAGPVRWTAFANADLAALGNAELADPATARRLLAEARP
jgi:hypothetical protein